MTYGEPIFGGPSAPLIDDDGDSEDSFDGGATIAVAGAARKCLFKMACTSGDDAEETVAFDETSPDVWVTGIEKYSMGLVPRETAARDGITT